MEWADEQWPAEGGTDEALGVYDQDEMTEAFCNCLDSHCRGFDLDAADVLRCGDCKLDAEANVDVEIDVDGDSNMFGFVCGIDDADDDELVTVHQRITRVCGTWMAVIVAALWEAVRRAGRNALQ